MSEVIFDGFDPDPSCHQPAPTAPQTIDPCTVKATFHLRGETTPKDPTMVFRRNKDRFVVENNSDEIRLGLLRNAGFKEDSPLLQSSLLYSVGLSRWMTDNYPGFVKDLNYKGADLLPLGKRVNNFILAGSIESPDEVQTTNTASLLKELLILPSDGRAFFIKNIEILKKDKYGTIRNEMQPRLDWLHNFLETYEKIQIALPEMKNDDALKQKMDLWLTGFIVHLATGQGDLGVLLKESEVWTPILYGRKGTPEKMKDFYDFLIPFLSGFEKLDFFKEKTKARERLDAAKKKLLNLTEDHRIELLSLGPDQAFEKSLEVSLVKAGNSGDLNLLVQDEVKSAKMGRSWLSSEDRVQEIAQAVLPSLDWIHDGSSLGWVRIDFDQMQRGLKKLIDGHSIQEREFLIGSLAALRFLFGKTLQAVQVKGWVKDQYQSLPLRLSSDERKQLEKIGLDLEKRIRTSLKQTNIILPWSEAAISVLGASLGTYGLLDDQRGFTVGGFTTAGFGLGAYATHKLFPTRNPYISDAIGGVLAGALTFALSYWLTKPSFIYGSPDRNPTMGYGP